MIEFKWSPKGTPSGTIIEPPPDTNSKVEGNGTALLTAIAKARMWIDDLASARAASFAEIATREVKVDRHIRLLAQLAFFSPRIIKALAEGRLTKIRTTSLARGLTYDWKQQEHSAGLR